MGEVDWFRIFNNMFLKQSGEHGIVGGPTGTGKTQFLFHCAGGICNLHPSETIAWFDVGKSSEPLRLADFRPIKILIPYGREIKITYKTPELEDRYRDRVTIGHYEDKNYEDMINQFEKDKINIIEIKPYIREPDEYAEKLE